MNPLVAFGLLPLNQDIPDPEDVTAGGVGAIVLVLLALAVVVLIFSFRKQLRKVRFDEPAPDDGEKKVTDGASDDGPESAGSYKP